MIGSYKCYSDLVVTAVSWLPLMEFWWWVSGVGYGDVILFGILQ